MSRLIDIDQIEADMILAEPVINKYRQTLIAAGSSLGEKHKMLLKTWNIRSVSIKERAGEKVKTVTSESKKLAENHLYSRMKWQPRIQIEKDLLEIGILRAAEHGINIKKDF